MAPTLAISSETGAALQLFVEALWMRLLDTCIADEVACARIEVRTDGVHRCGVSACTEPKFSRFVTIQSL